MATVTGKRLLLNKKGLEERYCGLCIEGTAQRNKFKTMI